LAVQINVAEIWMRSKIFFHDFRVSRKRVFKSSINSIISKIFTVGSFFAFYIEGDSYKKMKGREWMAKSYGVDRIADSPNAALCIYVIDFDLPFQYTSSKLRVDSEK